MLLHYNNAINLLSYICKIVAKRPGSPIAKGDTFLRRGNLQLMVRFPGRATFNCRVSSRSISKGGYGRPAGEWGRGPWPPFPVQADVLL